ncbi:PREDICTED: uncharacterized protein LOC104814689 [Tarenaya hassleriana]|uniref:uncharacterized protein LOC104814689 n=1 Tax=Tarenaya hassleriana TaxID=28532 RepID=UPI00053C8120|nr:PREDICTED: uncharacterized protein LOC104814689 [Tarenaya hassleriana]
MNVQETLNLFDSCWFERKIFKNRWNSLSPSNFTANPDDKTEEIVSGPRENPSIGTPSRNERSRIYDSSSPDRVLLHGSVFPGKETEENRSARRRTKGLRGRSETSKSASELESEELKGFMDLGFAFKEESVNSELVEILPGLQGFLGRQEKRSEIPRPYVFVRVMGLEKKRD